MRKPSVGIIFLTVFIDLIGFGLVIPLLPIYAKNFHASGWQIGAVMSAFSLMQFISGPYLGRLSDRIGRRPVLLRSTFGAAVSYVIFAYASGLEGNTALLLMFISRAFAGICGGNISVAQAYIADVTPPESRSKRMGLIGMAFGIGFVVGPILGARARIHFGESGPGWVAAALCAANFVLAYFILPESRQPGSAQAPQRPHLEQWIHTLTRPKVRLLIAIFFLATFCFTCFETTLGLLIFKNLPGAPSSDSAEGINLVSNLFIYAGLIGVLVQGGATGRLVKIFGEPKLVAFSLILVAISLGPMPFANNWTTILILLGLLAIGSSLTRPPVFGMISNLTSADEQGVTNGVAQSASSLARIAGPLFAAITFAKHPSLPYFICGGVSLLTAIFAWLYLTKGYVTPLHVERQKVTP